MDLLAHLQAQSLITSEQQQTLAAEVEAGTNDLEAAVLGAGVSETALRDAIAAYYGVPAFAPQQDTQLSNEILDYIPLESAAHYRMVPLKIEDGVLLVGVNDPEDLRVKEAVSFVSTKHGVPYKFAFVLKKDLDGLLKSYENLSGEVDQALTSLETELDDEIAQKQAESNDEAQAISKEYIKEDAPVTKIVATILRYAIDGGASDIHIEPSTGKVGVRFRVDGILQKSLELPKNVHSAIVARVKILSSLRLDEKRKPQDGRFSATFDGRKIDFRVSILPTSHGEKVVMRILDNERGITSLEATGISPHCLEALRRMMDEPYGIVLISGPTGSGKSTTLYTMLREMDRETKNILSLEDPVEYNVEGVSQSQVRPEIGFTFANGLRSALRQDPDVILVGEIRDAETAQLAIQAALTGHLVLSTIHTNNAIGVIARLVDMGIDPYLIAPVLKLAVAQRLSRKLCPGTGTEEPISESFEQMIEREFEDLPDEFRSRIPESRTIMHPEASPGCASGMKGRVAVMEAIEINDEIQSLILKGAAESEIYEVARKNGFMSMKEDAIIKALEHVIPFQEVSMYGTRVGGENAVSEEYLASDNPEVPMAPPQTAPVAKGAMYVPKNDAPESASSPTTAAAQEPAVDNPPQVSGEGTV